MTAQKPLKQRNRAVFTGAIILVIGIVWLLRQVGVYIPHWLFSWEMILIGIGLVIGIDSKFSNPASYVLILIGGVFLIDDVFDLAINIMEYFWPLLVIFIGLMIIIRPRQRKHLFKSKTDEKDANHDKMDLVSIFNGIKRNVKSKQFGGGESVTLFGGTELNLLQTDIKDQAHLECVVVFGGLKLIVPKNWEVRMDATSIFGGIEDKRFTAVEVVPENKVLILTGTVIFGGIDIVSY